jgi:hypothetical protein
MNAWDEMNAALSEARSRMKAADDCATAMARILVGRLRKVTSSGALCDLKRELRDFDMTTGKWKP